MYSKRVVRGLIIKRDLPAIYLRHSFNLYFMFFLPPGGSQVKMSFAGRGGFASRCVYVHYIFHLRPVWQRRGNLA